MWWWELTESLPSNNRPPYRIVGLLCRDFHFRWLALLDSGRLLQCYSKPGQGRISFQCDNNTLALGHVTTIAGMY
jgi:hypothetical protein